MKPCACGKRRERDRLVCTECWHASPMDIRIRFTHSRLEDRLPYARRLIEFARSRRPVKPAEPVNLELALT